MTYQDVMGRVAAAAERADRDPAEITVVAVSKEKPAAAIASLYEEGHRDFGENRAQELSEKAEELPSDIRWHFVGSLQSNKARLIRPITHLLHSMDRRSLAKAWLKGIGEPPPTLVQVDVGDESQKGGSPLGETPALIEYLVEAGIPVRGLMAIPPQPDRAEDSRRYFSDLRELRDRLCETWPGVVGLSMGMTDDFEVAIEEGSSIIRVGRAIFGPRN